MFVQILEVVASVCIIQCTVLHNNLDGFHRILHWKLVLYSRYFSCFLPLYFTTISLVCNNFWWCYLNFDNKNMSIFRGNYFLQSKKALVFSLNVRNNINQKTMSFCTVFCRKNHPHQWQFQCIFATTRKIHITHCNFYNFLHLKPTPWIHCSFHCSHAIKILILILQLTSR